jgi:maltose/maltodextrin transport system substrate-binding protein
MKWLPLTAALLAAPALAQTPKLLVWINGDKAYNGLQKVGNAFEKVSGVKVVVEHPVDATDKFQQAAGAGKGPDVFCWPHDRVGEWAKAGLLTPLRPSPRLKAEVEDQAWTAMTYRGRIWGYPIAIETTGLIYNKALVPKPPETWDDVHRQEAQGRRQERRALGLQQELLHLADARGRRRRDLRP